MVKLRRKNGWLYLDIMIDNTRKWEALHLHLTGNRKNDKEILELAEKCRIKRECMIVMGEWDFSFIEYSKIKFYDFADELLAIEPKRKTTFKSLYYRLKLFYPHQLYLKNVSKDFVEKFRNYLLDEGIKPTSINYYTTTLNYIMKNAEDRKYIKANPLKNLKPLSGETCGKKPLSLEELKKLNALECTGKSAIVKQIFLFDCYVGLRYSDLKSLTWGDINQEKGNWWISKKMVKTKRDVIIPIAEPALKFLDLSTKHKSDEFVFPAIASEKVASSNQNLKKITKLLKLNNRISWHTARHTAATLMLENGVDIRTISKILGHTGINMTSKYAEATSSLKVKAVEAIPDFTEN